MECIEIWGMQLYGGFKHGVYKYEGTYRHGGYTHVGCVAQVPKLKFFRLYLDLYISLSLSLSLCIYIYIYIRICLYRLYRICLYFDRVIFKLAVRCLVLGLYNIHYPQSMTRSSYKVRRDYDHRLRTGYWGETWKVSTKRIVTFKRRRPYWTFGESVESVDEEDFDL